MSAYKIDEIQTSPGNADETYINSEDYINVNFLALTLSCSYAKCYHWRELCEGIADFPGLFATSYESVIISK